MPTGTAPGARPRPTSGRSARWPHTRRSRSRQRCQGSRLHRMGSAPSGWRCGTTGARPPRSPAPLPATCPASSPPPRPTSRRRSTATPGAVATSAGSTRRSRAGRPDRGRRPGARAGAPSPATRPGAQRQWAPAPTGSASGQAGAAGGSRRARGRWPPPAVARPRRGDGRIKGDAPSARAARRDRPFRGHNRRRGGRGVVATTAATRRARAGAARSQPARRAGRRRPWRSGGPCSS